jgi:hypothetical protein
LSQESLDLVTGEHCRQFFKILGADLGKHLPIRMTDHFLEDQAGGSRRLSNGLGLPELLGFDVKNVVA